MGIEKITFDPPILWDRHDSERSVKDFLETESGASTWLPENRHPVTVSDGNEEIRLGTMHVRNIQGDGLGMATIYERQKKCVIYQAFIGPRNHVKDPTFLGPANNTHDPNERNYEKLYIVSHVVRNPGIRRIHAIYSYVPGFSEQEEATEPTDVYKRADLLKALYPQKNEKVLDIINTS